MKYDPQQNVDPAAWMAIDEAERLDAVAEYHRHKKMQLPSLEAHATFHTIVENQIAMGDAFPAKAVLARLMGEGLDRHEAVHALASVASAEMFRMLKDKKPSDPAGCARKIERLTAESWRKQFEDDRQDD